MARGRNSNGKVGYCLLGLLLVLLMLLGSVEVAAAAKPRVWYVGDGKGWTFDVIGWPNFKPFREDDVLLFRYKPEEHNVMVVNVTAHGMCLVPGGAPVYNSGNDRFTLHRGMNYFMCGKPGHCHKGMKLAVQAFPADD